MSDPNRRKGIRKTPDWSPREIRVMKSMWQTVDSLAIVSQRLGRSVHAIQKKAKEIGLGPFATLSGKVATAVRGPTFAERQQRHMLLVRNLRHRQALGFADAVILRTSASPIGPPLRSIEPGAAALIQQFLERRA